MQSNSLGRDVRKSVWSTRGASGCTMVEVKPRKWVNVESGESEKQVQGQRHARSHGLLSCLRLSCFSLSFPRRRVHTHMRVNACTDRGLSLALSRKGENTKGKGESTGGGLTDSALVCLVLFFRRTQAWPFVPFLSCPPWTLPRTRARARVSARRERE